MLPFLLFSISSFSPPFPYLFTTFCQISKIDISITKPPNIFYAQTKSRFVLFFFFFNYYYFFLVSEFYCLGVFSSFIFRFLLFSDSIYTIFCYSISSIVCLLLYEILLSFNSSFLAPFSLYTPPPIFLLPIISDFYFYHPIPSYYLLFFSLLSSLLSSLPLSSPLFYSPLFYSLLLSSLLLSFRVEWKPSPCSPNTKETQRKFYTICRLIGTKQKWANRTAEQNYGDRHLRNFMRFKNIFKTTLMICQIFTDFA